MLWAKSQSSASRFSSWVIMYSVSLKSIVNSDPISRPVSTLNITLSISNNAFSRFLYRLISLRLSSCNSWFRSRLAVPLSGCDSKKSAGRCQLIDTRRIIPSNAFSIDSIVFGGDSIPNCAPSGMTNRSSTPSGNLVISTLSPAIHSLPYDWKTIFPVLAVSTTFIIKLVWTTSRAISTSKKLWSGTPSRNPNSTGINPYPFSWSGLSGSSMILPITVSWPILGRSYR